MDAVWIIIFRLICAIVLLGQAAGAAYFATFARHQLLPYFVSHGMDADVSTVKLVFAYLWITAFGCSVCFVTAVDSIFRLRKAQDEKHQQKQKKRISPCRFLFTTISMILGIFALVTAVITAKASWMWSQYFEANGTEDLAQKSRGLAVMVITILVVTACSMLGSAFAFVYLVISAAKQIPQSDDANGTENKSGKDSTPTAFQLDIEAQIQATDVVRKPESVLAWYH